jgi:hypothetical protein
MTMNPRVVVVDDNGREGTIPVETSSSAAAMRRRRRCGEEGVCRR